MKLTREIVKSISSGVLDVRENYEGKFCFYRMSDYQSEEVYFHKSTDFYRKSFACAGVRLNFETNSTSFSFDYDVRYGASRAWYYIDVYVDGKLTIHQGENPYDARKGSVKLQLDGQNHQVDVWLPNLSVVRVWNVVVDDNATVKPIIKEKNVLIFGDSITHGYDTEYNATSYPGQIALTYNADVLNQAIGGELFHPEIIDPSISFKPDLIVIAVGTNDYTARTVDRFKEKSREFFQKIRTVYPDVQVVYIAPIYRGDLANFAPKEISFEEARQLFVSYAKEIGAFVIDDYDIVPHDASYYSSDFLHPNTKGHVEYAQKVLCAIDRLL